MLLFGKQHEHLNPKFNAGWFGIIGLAMLMKPYKLYIEIWKLIKACVAYWNYNDRKHTMAIAIWKSIVKHNVIHVVYVA